MSYCTAPPAVSTLVTRQHSRSFSWHSLLRTTASYNPEKFQEKQSLCRESYLPTLACTRSTRRTCENTACWAPRPELRIRGAGCVGERAFLSSQVMGTALGTPRMPCFMMSKMLSETNLCGPLTLCDPVRWYSTAEIACSESL